MGIISLRPLDNPQIEEVGGFSSLRNQGEGPEAEGPETLETQARPSSGS